MNKKLSSLVLAAVMLTGCASGSAATTSSAGTTASGKAAPAASGNKKIDDLTMEFVPSKDADVIITGTKGLDKLVIDAMVLLALFVLVLCIDQLSDYLRGKLS